MTVRHQISKILNAVSPRGLCDRCLAHILRCSQPHVNRMSRELVETSLFERRFDQCARCSRKRVASRSRTISAGVKTAPTLRLVN